MAATSKLTAGRASTLLLVVTTLLMVAGEAGALSIALPDGSHAPGCGLVRSDFPLNKPAARIATQRNHVSPEGWFRIHYDVSGDSAVDPTDTDGSGVPDWIELTAHVADSARRVFFDLGYVRDVVDEGGVFNGGGTEYDIYVLDLAPQHAYGFTWPGTNGYLQIDNNFTDTIYDTRGNTALRVTVAHELFHAVQFTYWTGDRNARWWQEATATFMEDVLYPDINDYWQYLNPTYYSATLFEDPSLPLPYFTFSPKDVHPYGAAVFCHYLDQGEPAKGHDAILYTFERQAATSSNALAVIVDALEERIGASMGEMLATFWVWSYFCGDRTVDGMFFRDAAGYTHPPPNGILEDAWTVDRLSTRGVATGTGRAEYLGASITRFVPDGSEGGIRIEVYTDSDGRGKWVWRVAVAEQDTIRILEPYNDLFEIGSWDTATDVVLIGANGATSGSELTFGYQAEHDTDLIGRPARPVRIEIAQNRPNPFNPSTAIPFTLSEDADITLRVYDVTGRLVRTVIDRGSYSSGDHTVHWDGTTDAATRAGAGLYVARISARGDAETVRMVLLR